MAKPKRSKQRARSPVLSAAVAAATAPHNIQVPGLPQRYSSADIEAAAEDARNIAAQDKIVQVCIAADVASRRLYMVARQTMDDQIEGRWDVENGELVVQTLVASAQDKSNDKFTAAELRDVLIQTVLPFLDILVKAERDNPPPEPPDAQPNADGVDPDARVVES